MKKLMGGVFSFGWLLPLDAAALAFFSLRGWLRGRRGAAAA